MHRNPEEGTKMRVKHGLRMFLLLSLLVAVTGPIAHADSFTYIYTSTDFGLSWTTAAISAITMETTVPAAELTASSTSGGFLAACGITSVVLDVGNGNTQTNFSPGGLASPPLPSLSMDSLSPTIVLGEPTSPSKATH
jgi:hypothetical protein